MFLLNPPFYDTARLTDQVREPRPESPSLTVDSSSTFCFFLWRRRRHPDFPHLSSPISYLFFDVEFVADRVDPVQSTTLARSVLATFLLGPVFFFLIVDLSFRVHPIDRQIA